MFFITNRRIDPTQKHYEKLTIYPNEKGPNELSAVEISGAVNNPTVTLVENELSTAEVKKYKKAFNLDIDENEQHFASLKIACEVFRQARRNCQSVLIYAHGYNNDIKDIYSTARELERLYGILVVCFTWPSNGGGVLSGTLSYISDKRDARASADALNRCIDLVGKYHSLLTSSARKALETRASQKFRNNPTKQRELLAKLIKENCDLSVSLLCHSMGNYVLKHALKSTLAESRELVFDNVILAAADANNKDHRQWVEEIQVRKSIYILINENDYALSWSRRKPGEEQLARLGHYLKSLDARNATYVDFTKEKAVNNSHSYFDAKTAKHNIGVKRFFSKALSGINAMNNLEYISHNDTYRPK